MFSRIIIPVLTAVLLSSCIRQVPFDQERQAHIMRIAARTQQYYFNLNKKDFNALWDMQGFEIKSYDKIYYTGPMEILFASMNSVQIQAQKLVEIDYPLASVEVNVFYDVKGKPAYFVCEKIIWGHVFNEWHVLRSNLDCNFQLTKEEKAEMKKKL